MVRSKRLKPIKELAKNREKLAAQELGHSLESQKLENQKLEQLTQYRNQYLADMEQKVRQGVSGATLQRYHQFLAKLDLAIDQQNDVLRRCSDRIDESQGNWQDKRSRTKVISQVMDKMAVKEQIAITKKEAHQSDELSTQAFLRRQQ